MLIDILSCLLKIASLAFAARLRTSDWKRFKKALLTEETSVIGCVARQA
jgi:hypothetical protein